MKVFRSSKLVMVVKLVITTSSFGIIISARNRVNTISRPANCSLAKAKAASVMTTSIRAVVPSVNRSVFNRYLPSGTVVKASA